MSESSEKAFDATPSRIAKARREGNIARSQEFSANVAFVMAAASVTGIAPVFAVLAERAIASAARGGAGMPEIAAMAGCSLAVIACAALAGMGASFLQSGGIVFTVPELKLSRLAPAEGIKRMLSRETATHAVRAMLAFALAGVAVASSMRSIFGVAAGAPSAAQVAALAWRGAEQTVFAAAAVGLAFAAVEYAVARRTWLSKLKMSRHELKRELRENDGDPAARGKRKSLHRSLIRGALSKVKDAAFVVVNPTHVAVALEYRPPDVPVPVVLVRAAGDMALRVRKEAVHARIPIVENVSLARALFASSDAGAPIPYEHYVAVAEVVAALVRSGVLE
jgi:flagellar biosynthesis protein FlhB